MHWEATKIHNGGTEVTETNGRGLLGCVDTLIVHDARVAHMAGVRRKLSSAVFKAAATRLSVRPPVSPFLRVKSVNYFTR